MRGLAMGPALGCPVGQAGVCAKRVTERVYQLTDYVILPDFDLDAEFSGFGCPPT